MIQGMVENSVYCDFKKKNLQIGEDSFKVTNELLIDVEVLIRINATVGDLFECLERHKRTDICESNGYSSALVQSS